MGRSREGGLGALDLRADDKTLVHPVMTMIVVKCYTTYGRKCQSLLDWKEQKTDNRGQGVQQVQRS
jgi:hypothetical protein